MTQDPARTEYGLRLFVVRLSWRAWFADLYRWKLGSAQGVLDSFTI